MVAVESAGEDFAELSYAGAVAGEDAFEGAALAAGFSSNSEYLDL